MLDDRPSLREDRDEEGVPARGGFGAFRAAGGVSALRPR